MYIATYLISSMCKKKVAAAFNKTTIVGGNYNNPKFSNYEKVYRISLCSRYYYCSNSINILIRCRILCSGTIYYTQKSNTFFNVGVIYFVCFYRGEILIGNAKNVRVLSNKSKNKNLNQKLVSYGVI